MEIETSGIAHSWSTSVGYNGIVAIDIELSVKPDRLMSSFEMTAFTPRGDVVYSGDIATATVTLPGCGPERSHFAFGPSDSGGETAPLALSVPCLAH